MFARIWRVSVAPEARYRSLLPGIEATPSFPEDPAFGGGFRPTGSWRSRSTRTGAATPRSSRG